MRGEDRASSLAFFGGHDEDAAGDHGDLFAAALGALWLCSLVLRDALGAFELLLALCAAVLVGWHDLVSGTAGQARRRKGYTRTARVERDFFGGRPTGPAWVRRSIPRTAAVTTWGVAPQTRDRPRVGVPYRATGFVAPEADRPGCA
jgi:hypothetical protein